MSVEIQADAGLSGADFGWSLLSCGGPACIALAPVLRLCLMEAQGDESLLSVTVLCFPAI